MGYLYQRKKSPFWWCQWYDNGRVTRESTRCVGRKAAEDFLKVREGHQAEGRPDKPRAEKVRFEEAEADLRGHYEAHATRDLKEYDRRVAHLTREFRGWRIASIDQAAVNKYVLRRQGQGMKNATIRRELGTLTKMLRHAYRNGKLLRLPMLEKPKEGPAREGFFERDQYLAVRKRLSEELRVAVTIAYTYGWRMQSEVLVLECRQVDLDAGTLRLDPGQTKNKEPRVIYLTPELKMMLDTQLARVEAIGRRMDPPQIVPFLFPRPGNPKKPRADFRRAWATACRAAGVPGKYRHDFRRTAVRNMEQAGVPRSVAMKMTGHLTENIYRRYAIVSPADLQDAARRLSTDTLADTPHRSGG